MERSYRLLAASLVLALAPLAAGAQDLDDIIEEAVAEAQVKTIKRDLGIRDSRKQTEAPEMMTNSTSLLDTSSVSDLFAFALSLSELTATSKGNGGSDPTAGSASLTAYALWSALEGFDPLDPNYYCENDSAWARSVSLSLGVEDGEDGAEDAYLAGLKFNPRFGNDLCRSTAFMGGNGQAIGAVKQAMVNLGAAHANLQLEIVGRVGRALPGNPNGAQVADAIKDDPRVREMAKRVAIELVDDRANRARELDRAIAEEIDRLTHGNQFALGITTKQRERGGPDEYAATLIWDRKGLLNNLDLSLNAGWELKTNRGASDNHGGMLAFGLQYQRADRRLTGRRPIRASLGVKAKWLTGTEDTYQGQLKFVLPILDGIELPISITAANRTELIEESEVRATFGFTIDTTNLLASFRR